jgi:hypothetical protein
LGQPAGHVGGVHFRAARRQQEGELRWLYGFDRNRSHQPQFVSAHGGHIQMKRYFLHLVYDHELVPDPEGAVHPSLEGAIQEAGEAIRYIAAEYLRGPKPLDLLGIRICDAKGIVEKEIFTVDTVNHAIHPTIFKRQASSPNTSQHPAARQ